MNALFARIADVWSGVAPLTALEAGVALTVGMLGICGALLAVLVARSRGGDERTSAKVVSELGSRLDSIQQTQHNSERSVREELARNREEFSNGTRHLREEVGNTIRSMSEGVQKNLKDVQDTMYLQLQAMRGENEKKLEQMRTTVDEKLQGTLEKRLGEAFKQVSERLESVHKGLGEMQTLAVGVGDLKKVLSNVKSRGTYGEGQLETLLDQTLAPTQWQKQVQVKRNSQERVDFGVRLPGAEGSDGEPVWLPLDSKFPQEDYLRLVDAQERAAADEVIAAGNALEQAVLVQARSIRDKYVSPPTTTDFAVMFLPTEGLYAEVLRRPGLAERLQRDCRVTLAGPTTVLALLNSLQMGFRTLAIQKRSSEVWKVLGAVKTEFTKFGDILENVEKKLEQASKTIGTAKSKTRNIERKLGKVEELPEEAAAGLSLVEAGDEIDDVEPDAE
jgi:DNA recombination protein RmuC